MTTILDESHKQQYRSVLRARPVALPPPRPPWLPNTLQVLHLLLSQYRSRKKSMLDSFCLLVGWRQTYMLSWSCGVSMTTKLLQIPLTNDNKFNDHPPHWPKPVTCSDSASHCTAHSSQTGRREYKKEKKKGWKKKYFLNLYDLPETGIRRTLKCRSCLASLLCSYHKIKNVFWHTWEKKCPHYLIMRILANGLIWLLELINKQFFAIIRNKLQRISILSIRKDITKHKINPVANCLMLPPKLDLWVMPLFQTRGLINSFQVSV